MSRARPSTILTEGAALVARAELTRLTVASGFACESDSPATPGTGQVVQTRRRPRRNGTDRRSSQCILVAAPRSWPLMRRGVGIWRLLLPALAPLAGSCIDGRVDRVRRFEYREHSRHSEWCRHHLLQSGSAWRRTRAAVVRTEKDRERPYQATSSCMTYGKRHPWTWLGRICSGDASTEPPALGR
jgi:hypothetical protein